MLGGGLIALLLVLNAASLYTARYAGRVYPGVRVAGVELGGLDREAARARLEADAAATGRHIDTATAAERALAVGRGGGLLPDAAAWLGALALGRDLAPPPAVVGGEPTPSPLAVGGEPAPPVEAPPVPSPEPVYPATVGGGPTVRDLGFGPSDAARVERLIASLEPDSPLRGRGALILEYGRRYRVDPLLIVVWAHESALCTTGPNTPAHGSWNCGNVVWAGMAPYATRWGCKPGPSSLGHHWGRCPTAEGGLGLWFEYVGTSPVYARAEELRAFAQLYSPCTDPENARRGFACDAAFADRLLALLRAHAGPPAPEPAPAPPPEG